MIQAVRNWQNFETSVLGTVHLLEDEAEFRERAAAWTSALGHQAVSHVSTDEVLCIDAMEQPACLVLDFTFRGEDGLDLQARLGREKSALPIVFIASRPSVRLAVAAMEQGAITVIERPCGEAQFAEAISEALTRAATVCRLSRRMEELRRRFANLSERERLVMKLVVDGRLNKAIARELKMTERTVERVRAVVLEKVGADSAVQMASLLTEHRVLGDFLYANCPGRATAAETFAAIR